MKKNRTVLGLGDLTYDHVFETRYDQVVYRYSRGGGSVFNLLANIAHLGGDAIAAGVGGEDRFGHAAVRELESLRVDTSPIKLLNGRSTLTIFESVGYVKQNLWRQARPSMSMTCPICSSKGSDHSIARVERKDMHSPDTLPGVGVVCFDRLTNDRIKLSLACQKNEILTALDLGRSGFIRYFPASRVVSALDAYHVVVIPERVATSLVKRTALTDISALAQLGPKMLMYVSKGERGVTLYDVRRRPKIKVTEFSPPQINEVVDDTGAGDAFFAGIIRGLCAQGEPLHCLEELTYDEINRITGESLAALTPVLRSIGARGHIPVKTELDSSVNTELQGLSAQEIRQRIDPSLCPFCNGHGSEKNGEPKHCRTGAKTNLQQLENRVLFALENRLAIAGCSSILKNHGTAYVIGTGGSYPAAVFIALLLNEHSEFFAQPIRPFDYVKTAKSSDWVIVVTYSGATSDCAEAMRHARMLKATSIALVTGVKEPKLKALLRKNGKDVLVSYGSPSQVSKTPRERGFVSIAGTVAPCAVWTAAVVGTEAMIKFAHQFDAVKDHAFDIPEEARQALKNCLVEGEPVTVMGGGLSWPAVLDLESKFVEAQLGILQLHELKDFSHGRFMSVLGKEGKRKVVVLLHVGEWNAYEKTLLTMLYKKATVILVECEDSSITGALEILIRVQFFAQECALLLKKDLSHPGRIPKEGLELYRWNKGLE